MPPTGRQLRDMFDEVRSLLDELELGVVKDKSRPQQQRGLSLAGLLDWARAAKRDGYPSRTLGDGSGPSTVLDDEGKPMPPVPDPLGELVVAPMDPVVVAARDVLQGLTGALGSLRKASTTLSAADRPPPENQADPGCRSCARIGVWSPVAKVTKRVAPVDADGDVQLVEHDVPLCRWCYDWNGVHREDPDPEILKLHHEGKRVTTRLVDEVKKRRAVEVRAGRRQSA